MGIDIGKFKALVASHGFELEELASFYAVRAGARSVYLSKRDRCGRVDLSGFTIDHPAIRPVPSEVAAKRKLGRVRAQLDFSVEERLVLEAFDASLEYMGALALAEEAALRQVSEGRKVRAAIPVERIEKQAIRQARVHVREAEKKVDKRPRA